MNAFGEVLYFGSWLFFIAGTFYFVLDEWIATKKFLKAQKALRDFDNTVIVLNANNSYLTFIYEYNHTHHWLYNLENGVVFGYRPHDFKRVANER